MPDVANLEMVVGTSSVRAAEADMANLIKRAGELELASGKITSSTKSSNAELEKAYGISQKLTTAEANQIRALEKRIVLAGQSAKEQAIQNAIWQSGAQAGSDAEKVIAALAKQHYELSQQQEKSAAGGRNFFEVLARRIIIALLIRELKELAVAAFNINSQFAAIAATVERTGISGRSLQGLQLAAGGKGIATNEFLGGMQQFSAQLNTAESHANELYKLFKQNGVAIRDSRDGLLSTQEAMFKVADLVKNAATQQDKFRILQMAGLPATEKWVQLLEGGRAGIAKAVAEFNGLSGATDKALQEAKRLEEEWNKLSTTIASWFKTNTLAAVQFFATAAQEARRARVGGFDATSPEGMSQFDAAARARAGGGTIVPPLPPAINVRAVPQIGETDAETQAARAAKTKLDTEQDLARESRRISLLGNLATVQQQVRQRTIELTQAALQNQGVTETQARQIEFVTRVQVEQARIQEGLTYGIFREQDAIKNLNEQLAVLKMRGFDVSQSGIVMAKRFEEMRNQAELARSPLEGVTRLAQQAGSLRVQLDQLGTSSLQGIGTELVNVGMRSESAGQAFNNMGNIVVRALINMGVQFALLLPLARAYQAAISGLGLLPVTPGVAGGAGGVAGGAGGVGGGVGQIIGATGGGGGVSALPVVAAPQLAMADLPVAGGGGGGMAMNVQIENYGGADTPQVTQSQGPDGEVTMRIMTGMFREAMSRGAFDKDFGGRFGVRPTSGRLG